ncbi:hypothetical protein [Deinococcus sp. NW-56]|uniref:hypothetical protein n=1 Tax=Deinococcus sp. NW-56 TaxID=2080419 RepID=UPI001319DB55|nr:hypothetical protein [Deinococcus sp. NW-56]
MPDPDRHAQANADQVRLLREALNGQERERRPRWALPVLGTSAALGLWLNWVTWQDTGILIAAGIAAAGVLTAAWINLRQ